jgi:hypothetical protein
MRHPIRNMLLASAAVAALAVPALADSYYFRTKPLVSPPQAFSFAAAANVLPGAKPESAIARVKGYHNSTATVGGGEYQICAAADCSDQGSNWRSGPTAAVTDDFYARLRVTAAAYGTAATATLTVGGTSAGFTATSRGKDTTPAAFSFAPAGGVEPGVATKSASATIVDHDGVTLSVSGGGYQICSTVACTEMDAQPVVTAASSEVLSGTRVRVFATPTSFGLPQTVTLTAGNTVGTFTATARAADTDPAVIAFEDKADATASAATTSTIKQLTDHDGITVSVSAGNTYRLCSNDTCTTTTGWTGSPSTASRNQYVQLQTTSATAGNDKTVTLTYGGRTATWLVKTPAAGTAAGAYYTGKPSTSFVNSTKQLAFVHAPIGTTFQTETQYASWCRAQGFEPKKSSASYFNNPYGATLYSSTAYISNGSCMFVDINNLSTNMTNTANYGLQTGTWLRVIDQGCGDYWSGGVGGGIETTSGIMINGDGSYSFSNYRFNGGTANRAQSKTVNVQDPAVVVCQTK